jgi:acetyl esterase/lipase
MSMPLMSRGLAVASLNYRWSNNAVFPAQIQDCKGALRFLRAHADEYSLDADRFGVFGDSAGGHLAALLGTSGGVASLEGDVGGNLQYASDVQVVADMYGPTDLLALGAILNGPDSIISLLFGWPIQDIIDHLDDPGYAEPGRARQLGQSNHTCDIE